MTEDEKNTMIREVMREWLADEMSEISEDVWCAGWLHDLEYILWEAVLALPNAFEEVGVAVDGYVINQLRLASEILGEWVVYGDCQPEPIAMAEWEKRFAEWNQQKKASV